jgi:hypothetical protein
MRAAARAGDAGNLLAFSLHPLLSPLVPFGPKSCIV